VKNREATANTARINTRCIMKISWFDETTLETIYHPLNKTGYGELAHILFG